MAHWDDFTITRSKTRDAITKGGNYYGINWRKWKMGVVNIHGDSKVTACTQFIKYDFEILAKGCPIDGYLEGISGSFSFSLKKNFIIEDRNIEQLADIAKKAKKVSYVIMSIFYKTWDLYAKNNEESMNFGRIVNYMLQQGKLGDFIIRNI